MESMRGYFEAACEPGAVRKQTRIRTSSRRVAEALHLLSANVKLDTSLWMGSQKIFAQNAEL